MFNAGGVDPCCCGKSQAPPAPSFRCCCDPKPELQSPALQCSCDVNKAAGPIIPNQRVANKEDCPCQKCRGQRGEVEMAASMAAGITNRISGVTQSLIQRVGGKRGGGCPPEKPPIPCVDEDATCFCVASPSAAKNFGCFLMETVSVITFFILAIVIFWLSVGYHLGQLVFRICKQTTNSTRMQKLSTNSPYGDNNYLKFPMSGLCNKNS